MNTMKQKFTYAALFVLLLTFLCLLEKEGGYIWQPEVINPAIALLFTLLVFLTGRLAKSAGNPSDIVCTAVFILLFYPDSHYIFHRDETAIMELCSACIVPFFISQYTRIADKDFKYGYFLMLFMGIFCSYTHDSITIPLCASFLLLSYLQRARLFKLACWPMVIGFLIGTTLSVLQSTYRNPASWSNPEALTHQTASGFVQLWENKVFLLAVLLTIYYFTSRRRRRTLLRIFHEHQLLSYCLLFSLCAVPFAPLGLENAISGVCFFCMFWVLFLFRDISHQIRRGGQRHLIRSRRET